MTINSTLELEKNNLINLKKNIWSFFPNHNKEFDDVLKNVIIQKHDYKKIMEEYQSLLTELNEEFNRKFLKMIERNSIEFLLTSQLIGVFIGALLPAIFLPMFGIINNNSYYIVGYISVQILFFIALNFIYKLGQRNLIQRYTSELTQLEEKIKKIEKEYKKTVKSFVKNGQELNIREHLNHYYQTNIPELNHIIQSILDESISHDFILTNNIFDNPEDFTILKTTYLSKITNYLDNMINEKIKSSIVDKMLSTNNITELQYSEKNNLSFPVNIQKD